MTSLSRPKFGSPPTDRSQVAQSVTAFDAGFKLAVKLAQDYAKLFPDHTAAQVAEHLAVSFGRASEKLRKGEED